MDKELAQAGLTGMGLAPEDLVTFPSDSDLQENG